MSLINKMLQDLEERDPEAAGNDSLHAFVRPAPVRRSIHPAWFIAAASTAAFVLALCGFSWHKMQSRIAEIPLIVQQAQLPLKMADSLSMPVPQAAEQPTQSSVARESAAGPSDISPTASNELAKTKPDDERIESAKPENIAFQTSSPPPKLSTRLSADATPASKKAESSAPEQDKARDRHPVPPVAAEIKNAPAEAAHSSAGNDSSALTLAKQVHELSPHEKAENEYRKAAGLIQQGRSAEAIATLEQGLIFDPRHAGARQALIGLLLDAKRIDDAMSRAKEGLALDATQTGLAMILARLQVEKGDLKAAVDTLQHSLPSGAENAEYQSFYAALMQRSGNHKEAIAHYEMALRSAPQNGVWWMGMAISLQADGQLTEAKEAYVRAKSSGTLSPALLAFVDQRLTQLQR